MKLSAPVSRRDMTLRTLVVSCRLKRGNPGQAIKL